MSPKAMLLSVAMFTNLNSGARLPGHSLVGCEIFQVPRTDIKFEKKRRSYTYRKLFKGARSRKFRQISH